MLRPFIIITAKELFITIFETIEIVNHTPLDADEKATISLEGSEGLPIGCFLHIVLVVCFLFEGGNWPCFAMNTVSNSCDGK